MSESAEGRVEPERGLCPRCAHLRVVVSSRGSRFLLCRLSAEDPRYRRYPPQPVLSCEGFRDAGGVR